MRYVWLYAWMKSTIPIQDSRQKTVIFRQRFCDTVYVGCTAPSSETCFGKCHESAQKINLLERVWSSLMTTLLENVWIISHVHDFCSLSIPCPSGWVCCHPVSVSVPALRVTSSEREVTGNHSVLAKRCSTMVVAIHVEISLQLEV